jgi:hypothetical protein
MHDNQCLILRRWEDEYEITVDVEQDDELACTYKSVSGNYVLDVFKFKAEMSTIKINIYMNNVLVKNA